MSKNSEIESLGKGEIHSYQIPRPSKRDMDLFKAIFDFHEDYRAEKLISLIDIFHEMLLLVAEDYSILYANDEAIKKMNLVNFHHHKIDEIVQLEKNQILSIFSGDGKVDNFYRFESNLINQPEVPINCEVSLFNLTSGANISFWIIQDISNYKRIESSLEKTDRKYKKILHETSDAVLILNNDFSIKEINSSGLKLLGIDKLEQNDITFLQFIDEKDAKIIQMTGLELGKLTNHHLKIYRKNFDDSIQVLLNFRNIPNVNEFIVFMKDVSGELHLHQLMLRTVVQTQEKERERFARDIHDDLGQQLSALKFNLSALRSYIPNEQARELLIESENILIDALASVRSICFDLMPKSLEKNGLIETIRELIRTMEAMNHVTIDLLVEDDFPVLTDAINVALYRIIQEFINNSIRHGKSFNIKIVFKKLQNFVLMYLSDDGKGFDMSDASRKKGNGLENIESRAKAYNGIANFSSKPGLGTSCEIRMPILNE